MHPVNGGIRSIKRMHLLGWQGKRVARRQLTVCLLMPLWDMQKESYMSITFLVFLVTCFMLQNVPFR